MFYRSLAFVLLISIVAITSAFALAPRLPQSGQIAFESNLAGSRDVWLLDIRMNMLHNLTADNPHYDGQPVWSPDGRRLAFVSQRNDGLGIEIFVMDYDGGNITQISPGGSDGYAPAWSPEGDQLAYVLGYNLVRAVDLTTMRERPLARGFEPDWSPDGQQVAYAIIDEQGTTHLAAVHESDGTPPRFLTIGAVTYDKPDWSPNGRYIAAQGYRGLDMFLYVLEVGCLPICQPQARRLTFDTSIMPDWSPDGAQIVYGCGKTDGRELCIIPADGGDPTVITHTPMGIYNDSPAWRP
jgi:Tol biopolymer transport system component